MVLLRYLLCFSIVIFGNLSSLYSNASSLLYSLKNNLEGMFASFNGNFTLVSASGQLSSGKIYYQYPNKVRLVFSNGKNVITNGRFLWLYNPDNLICVKQDVAGSSGGILSLLKHYSGQKIGERYIFTDKDKKIKKIAITVSRGMLKNISLTSSVGETIISFSNIVITKGMRSSTFYFKDVQAQVIENPLND